LGFRVWGLGFGVWGLGFGVWGLGFGVGVCGLRFRVKDVRLRFQSLGFRVQGVPFPEEAAALALASESLIGGTFEWLGVARGSSPLWVLHLTPYLGTYQKLLISTLI